jgi:hypothetical protein
LDAQELRRFRLQLNPVFLRHKLGGTPMKELIDLERQGWEALSTEGDAGRAFYASVLREDAVMLFPGGLRLDGRGHILQSIGAQPWQTFRMDEQETVSLSANVVTLIYRARGQREGAEPYAALITSTYVHEGEWKLVVHQHTPL